MSQVHSRTFRVEEPAEARVAPFPMVVLFAQSSIRFNYGFADELNMIDIHVVCALSDGDSIGATKEKETKTREKFKRKRRNAGAF